MHAYVSINTGSRANASAKIKDLHYERYLKRFSEITRALKRVQFARTFKYQELCNP